MNFLSPTSNTCTFESEGLLVILERKKRKMSETILRLQENEMSNSGK
jgi:hypothetical protein